MSSPENIGKVGEKRVARKLDWLPKEYITLNDIMLPTQYGTTQIDHIVLSPYGILEPVFVDESRNGLSGEHAAVRPRIVLISGPAIQVGEYEFIYDPDYFGKDPKRMWTGITLCVEADGDNEYKSAVQEINLQLAH